MTVYVDAEHIQKLLKLNKIERLSAATSEAARQHLEHSFPCRSGPTIVDWDRIPSTTLRWNVASDDDAARWAQTTLAGKCPLGLLLYSPKEPCLLGPFEFMIRNLDELVWGAAGPRLLFGVYRNDEGGLDFTKGIVEFDGKGDLFGVI